MSKADDSQQPDLVFWPVGLGDRTFADHLEVAREGGFNSLAVTPTRAKALLETGLTAADIKDQAAEQGIKLGAADGIATWVREWRSTLGDPGLREMMIGVFDIEAREALDISASLGMTMAVGVPFFDEGSIVHDEMVESFAAFCDLAKPYGIEIALEPIPFWGIPDLPLAWKVVREANRDNASITIDTWHIEKGSKDFDRDLALLETIPGSRLRHVQLADADKAAHADTLSGDVMFRKFPGEGELQLERMLAIVMGKGELATVGPEIVNAEQAAMDNRTVGQRSGAGTRNVIARARDLAARYSENSLA